MTGFYADPMVVNFDLQDPFGIVRSIVFVFIVFNFVLLFCSSMLLIWCSMYLFVESPIEEITN